MTLFLIFFKTSIFSYLLNYFLKKNYPEKYNEYLIAVSMNIIYITSVVQIKIKKCKKYIYRTNPRLVELINNYMKTNNDNKHNVEFILDGKVIYSSTRENITNYIVDTPKEDFILYSDYSTINSENICINKKIINDLITEDKNFDYELSDIRFMLCELIVGDIVYKIDLKSDNYNYYLVDNIINKKFIVYYLLNHYHETVSLDEIKNENSKFILKIIDNNVNICEIDLTNGSSFIQIKKDSYITN